MVKNIDCSTSIFVRLVRLTSELVVLDLTGLPSDAYIYVFTGTGRSTLRSISSQGGAMQRYNVLCGSMYDIDVLYNTLVRSYKTNVCACVW